MRKPLMLLQLLPAIQCGEAQSPHIKFSHFTVNKGLQATIEVKDNVIDFHDAIKEKIMQPFFTTKPTGEGTGLGLSLTYDMMVKGHGGHIAVDTKDQEYTEFTVTLPIT